MTLLEIVDLMKQLNIKQWCRRFCKDFATTFNAIAESAQEAFNLFLTLVNKTLKAKNRLQSQYELALGFAGDNTEAS
jgi:hypothetical protein